MKVKSTTSASSDFATLFEQSLTRVETYQPGQPVETTILSLSKDYAFLQLNGKSEGILALDELKDKDGQLRARVGDKLKVYFLRADSGEMYFTSKINAESAGTELLERAFQEKIPVEGLVEKEIKGGYEIKIGVFKAFCPYSQMGSHRVEDSHEVVGKVLTFEVQEYKDEGRKILVSNRVLHEKIHQNKIEELKKTLQVGMLVKGPVTSIQSFGVFVDLGGVQALLPVSEMGRTKVEDPHKLFTVGQVVEAAVLKLDWVNEKLSLSTKNFTADPWDSVTARYPEGSKHSGKVSRVTNYGAFVTLEPGLDGLIHVSEFVTDSRYATGEVPVKVGQTVSVQVLSADVAGRRLALKPATTQEEDAATAKYMEDTEGTTYNPFAKLLKKK